MMVEKEDLGLSLSLNFPAAVEKTRFCNSSSIHLNLMPSLASSSPRFDLFSGTNSFTSSDRVDVNRWAVMAVEVEEEAGISSPNSTISSISGKRSERDLAGEDHSDEEDGENTRKKLRLTKDQSAVLEEIFKEHNNLSPKQKQALAKKLGLRPRQVEVWFQNRRARTKMKQTEAECELMKRWYENLTQENRRLEKELQELRQFYMQRTPPTMCPSCSCAHVPTNLKLPNSPWAP